MKLYNAIKTKDGSEMIEYYTSPDDLNGLTLNKEIIKKIERNGKNKKTRFYYKDFMTLDIETYTQDKTLAWVYHIQVNVMGYNFIFRQVKELRSFLDLLADTLNLSDNLKLVVYVHNLPYEFQFLKHYLNIDYTTLFARRKKHVLRFETLDGYEYRCSYALTNLSLDTASKKFGCYHPKAVDDLDHTQKRTPKTELNEAERGYCLSDVVALREVIQFMLKAYNDDITTIPLTQTGYPRRDVKNACKSSKDYYNLYFKGWEPSVELYNLMMKAKRGGNTHSYRRNTGVVVDNVASFDFVSAYPYIVCNYAGYPVTPFEFWGDVKTNEDIKRFDSIINKKCAIFKVVINDIKLKKDVTIPYLSVSNFTYYEPLPLGEDNGRLLKANKIITVLTNIDFKILQDQYDYSSISISDVYIANKGKLPKEIRTVCFNYFKEKSDIKLELKKAEQEKDAQKIDELKALYMNSKQKLNGIFGMLFTAPINDQITYQYDNDLAECWGVDKLTDEEKKKGLKSYYRKSGNFANIQWGIFTTAAAREMLQKMINIIGKSLVYVDTDSCKFEKNSNYDVIKDYIEKYNYNVKLEAIKNKTIYNLDGKEFILGIFEYEDTYKQFKTLGAKKYVYIDEDDKLNVTISGVNKKKGSEAIGSIENFKEGFKIDDAGGAILYYNEDTPHIIEVDGENIEVSSNIAMLKRTYEIGITDEYEQVLQLWEV